MSNVSVGPFKAKVKTKKGKKKFTPVKAPKSPKFVGVKGTIDQPNAKHQRVRRIRVESKPKGKTKTTYGLKRYEKKAGGFKIPLANIKTGEVTKQIGKELEGSGELAKLSRKASASALPKVAAAVVSPLSAAGKAAGIPGLKDSGKFVENLMKDAIELPAQAAPSVYIPARAGVRAAKGDSTEAKALWKEVKEHDPIALTVQGKFKKAGKATVEHPLYTALELRGVKAGIGKSAGAAMRSIPGPTRRLASTKREPLKVYGNIKEPRRYSSDVFTKATQVAVEKRKAKKGQDPHQAPPRKIQQKLQRRVDEETALTEGVRRHNRDPLIREYLTPPPGRVRKKLTKSKTPSKAVAGVQSLAAQRIARSPESMRTDLAKYRAQLKAEQQGLSKTELQANKEIIKSIDRALKQRVDPKEVFAEAKRYIERQKPITQQLVKKGALEEGQAEKAALIPYARQHMGAKYERGVGTVDAEGKPLTAEAIKGHMRAAAVDEPVFVTQKPSARGAKNFYLPSQPRRQTISGAKRTGEATSKGTFDASREMMGEQLIHDQGMLDAVKGFDRNIQTFGLRKPDGKFFKDFDEAHRFLGEVSKDEHGGRYADHLDLQPVRIAPFAATKKTTEGIKRGLETDDTLPAIADAKHLEKKVSDAYNEAVKPGDGPVVLMPRVVMERFQDHARRRLAAEKATQAVTNTFKQTVLPTSTKWIFGNLADISMRSLLEGLTPGHYRLGRRYAKRMGEVDPERGLELDVRALGGSHYSSIGRQIVHRTPESFGGGKVTAIARALDATKKTPGPKQVVGLWRKYRDGVFALNTWIEKQPQYAALGKAVQKDLQDLTGKWHSALMVGDKALDDMVRHGRLTENQVAYGRNSVNVFGNWDKNSPEMRKWLLDYMPFGMWARAASRYVLVTFPKDHPVQAGLLAAAENMTQKEREAYGLTWFSKRRNPEGAKALPPFLQGSFPSEAGLRRFQGFTSFGFFADYPSALAEQLLPQVPILATLQGLNWKGDKLVNADGSPMRPEQRVALGLYVQTEAWVPLVGLGRRILESGGTSEDDSTIFSPKTKEGTRRGTKGAVNKIFNPFAPISGKKNEPKIKGFDWSKVNLNTTGSGGFDWSKVNIK